MNNEPVAYVDPYDLERLTHYDCHIRSQKMKNGIPLYTHPVKSSICVGYWDYKTGSFHQILTKSQQKRVDDGFLKPVYTEEMLPAKTLTDEEILREAYYILMREQQRKAQEK